jgi:protein TonB
VQNECHLQRDFGSGDGAVSLDIGKAAGRDKLDLTLFGAGIPKLPPWLDLAFRLDPQGFSRSLTANSNRMPKGSGRFVVALDADAAGFAGMASEQTLSFSFGKGSAISLNVQHAKEALAALQTCYEDLLHGWNVDPAAAPAAKFTEAGQTVGNPGTIFAQRADAPAQPLRPGAWVSWKDYPTAALQEEKSGTVVMALSVDPNGHVGNCRVVVSSNFKPLDDAACQAMSARARYTPPKSAGGDPLLSTAVERIRWVIPE